MVMDSVLCQRFGFVMKLVLSRWNIPTRKSQFITFWPLFAQLLVEHSLLLEWLIQWFSQHTIWSKKHPKANSVNQKKNPNNLSFPNVPSSSYLFVLKIFLHADWTEHFNLGIRPSRRRIQVKAYLLEFRLKFCRKHYVGFDCVSFLGRISNGTPGS